MTDFEKLLAIEARVNGAWDNKHLLKLGLMSPSLEEDILYILHCGEEYPIRRRF